LVAKLIVYALAICCFYAWAATNSEALLELALFAPAALLLAVGLYYSRTEWPLLAWALSITLGLVLLLPASTGVLRVGFVAASAFVGVALAIPLDVVLRRLAQRQR
jgi:hypothetical protein